MTNEVSKTATKFFRRKPEIFQSISKNVENSMSESDEKIWVFNWKSLTLSVPLETQDAVTSTLPKKFCQKADKF